MIDSIKLLFGYLSKDTKRKFFFLITVLLVVALCEVGTAATFSLFGAALASPDVLTSSGLFKAVAEIIPCLKVVTSTDTGIIILLLCCLVVATLIKNAATLFSVWFQNFTAEKASYDIANVFFKSLLGKPYSFFLVENSAKLQTELGWRTYVGSLLTQCNLFISNAIIIVALLTISFLIAPMASAVVFLGTAVFVLVVMKTMRKKIASNSSAVRNIELDSSQVTLSAMQGICEVKIYKQEHAVLNQFSEIYEKRPYYQSRALLCNNASPLSLEVVGMTMLAFVAVMLVSTGSSFSELVTSLSLLAGVCWRLLPAFNKITKSYGSIQLYRPYVKKILARILSSEDELIDSKSSTFDKEFALEDITYSYPGAETPALSNVSIQITKGKSVGVIGRSGAGKSTLTGVLTGLYTIQSGKFTIDGVDLDKSLRESWASRIGYVPQSTYLLDASLAENVAFSALGQPIDRERVYECCNLAGATFWNKLEDGIDTKLGERGVRLSGGQIQRISIARALYRKPEVIIFDEATSALDSAAEAVIQETIKKLQGEITLVIIAHRLSTVEDCDEIFWLENGELKMSGCAEDVILSYSNMSMNKELANV